MAEDNIADSGMISAITGGPVEGLLFEPRRKKISQASAIGFYAILLLILYLLPAALPDVAPPDDSLAFGGAAGKEEYPTGSRVTLERFEHPSLVVRTQVEETIPGDQDVKLARNVQLSHIGLMPRRIPELAPAKFKHLRNNIDTSNAVTVLDEVTRDGFTCSTAEVQHRSWSVRQSRDLLEIRQLLF